MEPILLFISSLFGAFIVTKLIMNSGHIYYTFYSVEIWSASIDIGGILQDDLFIEDANPDNVRQHKTNGLWEARREVFVYKWWIDPFAVQIEKQWCPIPISQVSRIEKQLREGKLKKILFPL